MKSELTIAIPCSVQSIYELPEPRKQVRIKNGVEVATNRLDFTHVMQIVPDLQGMEITPAQAEVIENRRTIYLTAYELEHIRALLQAPDYTAVCGLVSNSNGNDPCIVTIEYSEYLTGKKYVNAQGDEFHLEPTDDFPVGSTRTWIDLPRQFFTVSDSLKSALLQAHLAAQTKHLTADLAERQSAMARTKALLKQRSEAARAKTLARKLGNTGENPGNEGADPGADTATPPTPSTSPKPSGKS